MLKNQQNEKPCLMILGCGYVGAAVAELALSRGWRVHALTRNADTARALLEQGVERVWTAHLESEDWHEQTEVRYKGVLNCVSGGGGGIEGYQRSYVEGMRSVVRWAEGREVGTFVYTSSTGVYAQGGGMSVDEESLTVPVSDRGALLLEAEQRVRAVQCARWFILRLAGIYGPGRHHLLDALRARTTSLAGSAEHWLNLIHRDDVASAVLAALEARAGLANRVYNLTDGVPTTRGEVVGFLAAQLSVPAPVFDPQAQGSRSVASRRIISRRVYAELAWTPRFQSFREGFGAILQ